MNDWLLLRRFFAFRPLQNSLAVLVTAAGIAVSAAVMLLAEGIHGGLVRAAAPFPMLMGAKGSPNQLLLNAVFLQDQPAANFSWGEIEALRGNECVEAVVPLAFGDNYRGFRVVGTDGGIFSFSGVGQKEPWLKVASGRAFEGHGEAVLGAETASRTGLKIGDTFAAIHGVTGTADSHSHDGKFTVTGILAPVRGPYDSCILTDIEGVWDRHAEHGGRRQATAAVVKPAGYAAAMRLAAEYSSSPAVQMIFPSQSVIRLFSIMGNVEKAMKAFSAAVVALSLVITAGAVYWLVASGRRDQGVMRALGATAGEVSSIYFRLGVMMTAAGTLLGLLCGHAVFAALASLLEKKASLYLMAAFLPDEAILAAAALFLGAAASLLPASLLAPRDICDWL